MWSSQVPTPNKKMSCDYIFKLSSTSSLPINLIIVSKMQNQTKVKTFLKHFVSSTYSQGLQPDLTQNQLNVFKKFLKHLTLSTSFFLSPSNSISPISLQRRYWANPADTLCDYAGGAEPRWVAHRICVGESGNVLRNHHRQQQQRCYLPATTSSASSSSHTCPGIYYIDHGGYI